MLCQECRFRPASVKITTIVDNQKADVHLCDQCASVRGELEFSAEGSVSLGEMLAALLHHQMGATKQAAGDSGDIGGGSQAAARCPTCGLTYERFSSQGKLGCSECFKHFERQLRSVLRHLHGSTRHAGRSPRRAQRFLRLQRDLRDLRAALDQAVSEERFERAAEIRDQIKLLEQQAEAPAGAGRPDEAQGQPAGRGGNGGVEPDDQRAG